jgi:nucleotide-binding universal stress UspA family protein
MIFVTQPFAGAMLHLDHVLLARDFSPVSDQAMQYALGLAQQTGATLHLLYADVLHEDPFGKGAAGGGASAEERIHERLRLDADGTPLTERFSGITVQTEVRRAVAAAPAILGYATDAEVDLIVMGTHGRRGVRRLLMGSVAEEVVRRAQSPVLTVRKDGDESGLPTVERILVPIDFSEFCEEALRCACELATHHDAQLDLLHVIEENLHPAFYVGGVQSIYDVQPDIEDKVRTRMRAMLDEVDGGDEIRAEMHVADGRAARKIIQFAERQESDLVVMSTHGLTGLEHFLMGSVAEKVVRHVTAPVLTVKAFGTSLLRPSAEAGAATR